MTNNLKGTAEADQFAPRNSRNGYNRFLLIVAGLGGLLYGVDVGIIAGALPYLEAAFKDAATGHRLQPTFLLPETKGKTLEEIEQHFEGK